MQPIRISNPILSACTISLVLYASAGNIIISQQSPIPEASISQPNSHVVDLAPLTGTPELLPNGTSPAQLASGSFLNSSALRDPPTDVPCNSWYPCPRTQVSPVSAAQQEEPLSASSPALGDWTFLSALQKHLSPSRKEVPSDEDTQQIAGVPTRPGCNSWYACGARALSSFMSAGLEKGSSSASAFGFGLLDMIGAVQGFLGASDEGMGGEEELSVKSNPTKADCWYPGRC